MSRAEPIVGGGRVPGDGPMILTMVPYDPEKNLGRAYNRAMALLPDDGWGVLLDHDVMWTTKGWWLQIRNAIRLHPEGVFTGVTNRIGNSRSDEARVADGKPPMWQRIPTKLGMMDCHDILKHRALGDKMLRNLAVRDVTAEPWSWCGFLMIISKSAWLEAGRFEEKARAIPGPDRTMYRQLKACGRRIYLIEGLYLYHLWRADGSGHPWDYTPS